MSMPILPGLMDDSGEMLGDEVAPSPLTELLDSLSEEEADALAAEAGGGEVPEGEEVEEAEEGEDDDAAEEAPFGGEEAEESEEPEEAEEEDPDALLAADMESVSIGAQAAVSEIEGALQQLDMLHKEATAAEEAGGDPSAIEELRGEVEDLQAEAIEHAAVVDSAKEPEEAATAALLIKEKADMVAALVSKAATLAKANRPVAPSAMSMWAERNGG